MTERPASQDVSSAKEGWATGMAARLRAPRDIAALAAFRVAFGTIVAVSALRFLCFGWIDQLFTMPRFHFRYWAFGWVPTPSAPVVWALFVLLCVLGVLVAVGLLFRPAV